MPRYWFRQKTFGYGATPSTWQGWALTVVGLVLLFGVVMFGPAIRDNVLRALWMVMGLAAVLVPFCAIAYSKTEGGWRWRNGRD
jgi:hypothetical protein